MKFFGAVATGALLMALPLRAVYAPIPEQEQGKDLVLTLRGSLAHDSNIFGGATDTIDSFIYTLAPRATYNTSLTAQTFFSGSYGLALDRFQDRPGKKLLDSHDLSLRLAHAFSRATTVDLNNAFTVSRNPESVLPGVAGLPGVTLNSDQSSRRNQLDGRISTAPTPKVGLTAKARSMLLDYRNAALGRSLDRSENLYGLSGDYAILPEVRAVAEYRHQDVYYRKLGEIKNKRSDYLMAGVDYSLAQKLTLTARLGHEWRQRLAESDTTSPYAEVSGKYDYAEGSYLVGGYAYTLEETSDPSRYTDTKLHRMFVNVQHRVTGLIVASGSLGYEPSQLQARDNLSNPPSGAAAPRNVDETTFRVGAALSYLPNKRWTVSATYDVDRVYSDDAVRDLRRVRVGVSAVFSF